jgi:hypothetical protein
MSWLKRLFPHGRPGKGSVRRRRTIRRLVAPRPGATHLVKIVFAWLERVMVIKLVSVLLECVVVKKLSF